MRTRTIIGMNPEYNGLDQEQAAEKYPVGTVVVETGPGLRYVAKPDYPEAWWNVDRFIFADQLPCEGKVEGCPLAGMSDDMALFQSVADAHMRDAQAYGLLSAMEERFNIDLSQYRRSHKQPPAKTYWKCVGECVRVAMWRCSDGVPVELVWKSGMVEKNADAFSHHLATSPRWKPITRRHYHSEIKRLQLKADLWKNHRWLKHDKNWIGEFYSDGEQIHWIGYLASGFVTQPDTLRGTGLKSFADSLARYTEITEPEARDTLARWKKDREAKADPYPHWYGGRMFIWRYDDSEGGGEAYHRDDGTAFSSRPIEEHNHMSSTRITAEEAERIVADARKPADPHRELREAHAKGAQIQFRAGVKYDREWEDCWLNQPCWVPSGVYRIKPDEKPPMQEQREYHSEGKLHLLHDESPYRAPLEGELCVTREYGMVIAGAGWTCLRYILTLIDPPKPSQEKLDEWGMDIDGEYPVFVKEGDTVASCYGISMFAAVGDGCTHDPYHGYRWKLKKRVPKVPVVVERIEKAHHRFRARFGMAAGPDRLFVGKTNYSELCHYASGNACKVAFVGSAAPPRLASFNGMYVHIVANEPDALYVG